MKNIGLLVLLALLPIEALAQDFSAYFANKHLDPTGLFEVQTPVVDIGSSQPFAVRGVDLSVDVHVVYDLKANRIIQTSTDFSRTISLREGSVSVRGSEEMKTYDSWSINIKPGTLYSETVGKLTFVRMPTTMSLCGDSRSIIHCSSITAFPFVTLQQGERMQNGIVGVGEYSAEYHTSTKTTFRVAPSVVLAYIQEKEEAFHIIGAVLRLQASLSRGVTLGFVLNKVVLNRDIETLPPVGATFQFTKTL